MSNTSPISNLAMIGQLNLLREQFQEVFIPTAVFKEMNRLADGHPRDLMLQAIADGWLIIKPTSNFRLVRVLRLDLHLGEAEAIALASEINADLVLIDERDGRQAARAAGLEVRGVLGILLRAKKTGRLGSIRDSVQLLRQRARFFIAPALEQQILEEAGEA